MTDGWFDKREVSTNFLDKSPHGTLYLYSIDVSGHKHTGELLCGCLDESIENIGAEYVNLKFVLARQLLREKSQKIF